MTKTENYQLPQWEADDPVKREDFNGAMANIDTALETKAAQTELEAYRTSNDAAVAALDSKLTSANAGLSDSLAQAKQELAAGIEAAQTAADTAWSPDNMPYAMGTYRGTGEAGADAPCRITVGFRPSALLVCPALIDQEGGLGGAPSRLLTHLFAFYPGTSGLPEATVTWLDDGVSWYASTAERQCNTIGFYYLFIAFR